MKRILIYSFVFLSSFLGWAAHTCAGQVVQDTVVMTTRVAHFFQVTGPVKSLVSLGGVDAHHFSWTVHSNNGFVIAKFIGTCYTADGDTLMFPCYRHDHQNTHLLTDAMIDGWGLEVIGAESTETGILEWGSTSDQPLVNIPHSGTTLPSELIGTIMPGDTTGTVNISVYVLGLPRNIDAQAKKYSVNVKIVLVPSEQVNP